jgi:hypothetical protein
MQLLQQSEATAAQRRIFFHAVDATDGITAETGLTGAGRISKNGAATAASTANITEIDSTNMPGRYYIELTATELDTLGIIEFRFKAAACAEVVARGQVVPFDPYDAMRAGLTALPNAAAEAAGGLYTRGAGAGQINQSANGQIDVNAQRLNNVAQSLLDLVDFADAGYDPATNKVQGVVLVDTLTTYTGNTPQTGDSFARLGAPAGASVSADIAVIEAQTDDIGVAGAGLTALGDVRIANLDATVSSRLATAGYTAPLDAAGTRTAVGLAAANLDTQLAAIAGFIDTEVASILAAIDTEVAAILADTNELQVDWTNGGRLDLLVDAIKAKTDNLPASPAATGDQMALTAAAVDAILDDPVEGANTLRQLLRGFAAALLGKASGLDTNAPKYRNLGDTKNVIDATTDANGNRTAVTLDLT